MAHPYSVAIGRRPLPTLMETVRMLGCRPDMAGSAGNSVG